MKLAIGSDHGGYALKEAIKAHFPDEQWKDVGTHGTESVDYPEFARKVCHEVLEGRAERGIVVCGTGIGVSIAANRLKGIRAALVHDAFTAEMSRKHNNANVLALGGRVIDIKEAVKLVDIFLKEEFEGGRHERRLQSIEETGG